MEFTDIKELKKLLAGSRSDDYEYEQSSQQLAGSIDKHMVSSFQWG